jgi:CubicO group peptidase (beta-lactamase class C family)
MDRPSVRSPHPVFRFLAALVAITLFIAGSISASPPLSAGPATTPDLEDRIRRVENGLPPVSLGENEPPFQLTLAKLMEIYNVPGLSIAVMDNFEIAWAKGYGVTEAGGDTPVTTRTLFQAGSVSKPVPAIATMSLVQQGELSLDQDVNVKLKSWKVPENEFTKDQKITLRRILSHTTPHRPRIRRLRSGRACSHARADPERRKARK